MIEIYVSIICVCISSLKLGLQRAFPKILRRIHGSHPKYTGSGQSGGSTEQGSVVQLAEIVGVAKTIQTAGERRYKPGYNSLTEEKRSPNGFVAPTVDHAGYIHPWTSRFPRSRAPVTWHGHVLLLAAALSCT